MLENKVIVVTGGSGLIGKAIINNIRLNHGFPINVDIDVRSNLNKGTVYCDITQDQSISELLKEILDKYERIDGWVNNAYPRTNDWANKFENIVPESWRKNIDMQLNSVFVICQRVLEVMKLQKKGSIVNIASIYGVVGNDFSVYDGTDGMTSPAAYSAIKGGIINFSRYLASYYGRFNVRVNCVSPGGIFNSQHAEFIKNFEYKVPLKRLGKPEDVAPAVSFLLSDNASYITGHNLMIDGGWTAI